MNPLIGTVLLGCTMFVCACGGSAETPKEPDVASSEDGDSVFEPMTEALDRAEGVEAEAMEGKRRADAALERMERGGDPEG